MGSQTQAGPTTVAASAAPPPPAKRRRRVLRWAGVSVVLVVGLLWVGLQIQPKPLPRTELQAVADLEEVPLPAGLPSPVDRFYRTLYGDEVPQVHSAIITGRGTMRLQGVTLPTRFRFSHVTGRDYRHYIENTWFGVRVLTVDEWFTDGTGRMLLPFGEFEGAKIDQGANLALWAENVFMPSVWITDPQVSWEAIDETSARLVVPSEDGTETFTVMFDADSGLLERMESMRFKGEAAEAKTLWINEVQRWGELDGHPVPLETTLTWADEGRPWARLRTEDVRYNADLSRYIRAAGP
jgi:hypothetical protein